MGANAGAGVVSASNNVFIGNSAGRYTKGDANTYVGRGVASQFAQTTASARNTAIGEFAMGRVTTGDDNNAFGSNALTNLRTGNNNVVVGGYALGSLTTGSNNTVIGVLAAQSNNGDNNVYIGHQTAYFHTGSRNIFIGADAGYGFSGTDSRLVIHHNGDNDPLIHGDFAVDSLRINGSMSVRDVPRNNTITRIVTFDSANGKLQSRDVKTVGIENLITVTSTYTVLATDNTVLGDATAGAFTITLPPANGLSGKIYTFKKIDSGGGNVTIDGDGAETIDGNATFVLQNHHKYVTVQTDGVTWYVIANN
jgi:hypothetical protein